MKKLKKIICLVILLTVLFCFCACSAEQRIESLEKKNADLADKITGLENELVGMLNSESLSIDMIKQIKQDYLEKLHSEGHNELTIDAVLIYQYYGIYNNSIPIMMNYTWDDSEGIEYIGGIFFKHQSYFRILVWNNGTFCELNTAYEHGLLTKEDLLTISYLYNCYY